jgi:CheY-like chemotaxis protein
VYRIDARKSGPRKIWPENWPKAFSRLRLKRDSAEVSKRTNGGMRLHQDSGISELAKGQRQVRGAPMPRILVVDDDPMVCMAIEIYLERHSFQVTIADGGEAGLRALEGMAFDLMIVDIFMPHMRGFESIRIFHERAPSVPLIAMSGYAFANLDSPAPDFLRMALELGATRCLRKPFTPVALLMVINECLAEVQSGLTGVVEVR